MKSEEGIRTPGVTGTCELSSWTWGLMPFLALTTVGNSSDFSSGLNDLHLGIAVYLSPPEDWAHPLMFLGHTEH